MSSETKAASDVQDVLKKLREQLAQRAKNDFASNMSAHAPFVGPTDTLPALRQLLAVMESSSRQIGELNPRNPGVLNSFVQRLKQMLQRMLAWYTRPITEAHALNRQFLAEATRLLELHEAQFRAVEQRLRLQREELVQVNGLVQSKLDWIIRELEKREGETP